MSKATKTKTVAITIPEAHHAAALKRCNRLEQKFSQYVVSLIEADLPKSVRQRLPAPRKPGGDWRKRQK